MSAGLRFDYHGGFKEKYGRLYNFDPSQYDYDATADMIVSNGFIIAGNNKDFPSKGVSDSTLTGRQWGLAPRIGIAWSPKRFDDKVVVRAGWGMYYDRGELFTYLSPGFAAGLIPGGPFGVNQSPPWVNSQVCTTIGDYYEGFIPTCDPNFPTGGSFSNPWGAALQAPPTGDPSKLVLPNAAAIEGGAQLFSFADVYKRQERTRCLRLVGIARDVRIHRGIRAGLNRAAAILDRSRPRAPANSNTLLAGMHGDAACARWQSLSCA